MRAVVITKTGDPSVLKVEERPDPPAPGPGQVKVEVRAAGVNFADTMARVGLYEDAPPLPAGVFLDPDFGDAGLATSSGFGGDRYMIRPSPERTGGGARIDKAARVPAAGQHP